MKMYAVLSTLFSSIELTKWGRFGEKTMEVNNPGNILERQQKTAALTEPVQSGISRVFIKCVVSNLVLLQHLNQKLCWKILRPHQSLLRKQILPLH